MRKVQRSLRFGILTTVFQLGSFWAHAQSNLDSMSLEQLMDVKVTIASPYAKSVRESPGIVSVLTHEDIQSIRPRDLNDLFRHIPGIDIGHDVDGATGIGIRGMWGQEGKVLILWDGMELQETSYAAYQLNQHYPVELIQRIEVIRGPGSVMYGGNAALAVIRILTLDEKPQSEIKVWQQNGFGNTYATRNQSGMRLQWAPSKHTYLRIQGAYSFGIWGEEKGEFVNGRIGNTASMTNQDYFLQVSAKHNNLEFHSLLDQFQHRSNTGVLISHSQYQGLLKLPINLNKKWTLSPQVLFRYQLPWNTLENQDSLYYSSTENQRLLPRLTIQYNPTKKIELSSITDYCYDVLNARFDPIPPYSNLHIHINNFSQSIQATYNGDIQVTAGARIDFNNFFGDYFVPRLAVGKVFGKFHSKILLSSAFKSPTLLNLYYDKSIQPERVATMEAEVGYQKTNDRFIRFNAFYTNLDNPIIYLQIADNKEGYRNSRRTGSSGFEVVMRYKANNWIWNGFWSYQFSGQNLTPEYQVPGANRLLGFSHHRLSSFLEYKAPFQLKTTLEVHFWSQRTGFVEGVYKDYAPSTILNFHVKKNFLHESLQLKVGLYDIFNQQFTYLQMVKGETGAISGLGRELYLSVNYRIFAHRW